MPLAPIATLPNLRDVGGRPTSDGGWVREGLLFRSVELCALDDAGLASFARLGVRTVFDLRTPVEQAAGPDRLPPGTDVVSLDLLADTPRDAPSDFAALLGDPERAARKVGVTRTVELYEWGYRRLAHEPGSTTRLRQLYSELAQPGRRPALIHCASGKDRTGWAIAVLLLLPDVPEDEVMHDYLLSNEQLLPGLASTFDDFAARGGDPAALREVLAVRPQYLRAAIHEMTDRFGSADGYAHAGLGLDNEVLHTLRSALVVRAG